MASRNVCSLKIFKKSSLLYLLTDFDQIFIKIHVLCDSLFWIVFLNSAEILGMIITFEFKLSNNMQILHKMGIDEFLELSCTMWEISKWAYLAPCKISECENEKLYDKRRRNISITWWHQE